MTEVKHVRLLLGFAILPPLNAFLAFLLHQVVWPVGPFAGARWGDTTDAAASFAAGVAILAVLMTVAGAVPLVAWLRRRECLSLPTVTVAAVILGNVPYLLSFAIVLTLSAVGLASSADMRYVLVSGPVGAVRAVLLGSVLGFVSGVAFWFVAMWRLPGTEPPRAV